MADKNEIENVTDRTVIRGLSDIAAAMIRESVGRHEYVADQRYTERRFHDMESDVTDLKDTHASDVKEIRENIASHIKEHSDTQTRERANWLQFFYAGIIPFGIAIAVALFSAWLAAKGSGK